MLKKKFLYQPLGRETGDVAPHFFFPQEKSGEGFIAIYVVKEQIFVRQNPYKENSRLGKIFRPYTDYVDKNDYADRKFHSIFWLLYVKDFIAYLLKKIYPPRDIISAK
ncbi:MAG: hypothetical protein L6Q54_08990 [Leptospiraceae bacterium]|nr:hypothetical protein [Leptospiraceae bacterium]MCK6381370.1 hypothetical protein [Leptospiraceae bacterium]